MNKLELINFLNSIKVKDTIIKISFFQKNKGLGFSPEMSFGVKEKIFSIVKEFIIERLEKEHLVSYDPMGVFDGEIEYLDLKLIEESQYCKLFLEKEVLIDGLPKSLETIDFYEILIKNDNQEIKLYRQFQKMKKLRKGIVTRIVNNELNVIENDIISIDGSVDLIIWKDKVIALNHIALERIFNFKDMFEEKTKHAIHFIRDENIIYNIDQFEEDCMNDSRLLKKFTKIMSQERLPLFFDNYDKVPEIIKSLELSIEFSSDKKIIYHDKKQLFHIVNLMADAYFKSLLAQRYGVAKVEGNINE